MLPKNRVSEKLAAENLEMDSNLIKTLQQLEPLLIKAKNACELAWNQDKVLLLGATGAGKSTLLNYLNGAKYKLDIDEAARPFARCVDAKEFAEIGQGMESQTLFPQILKKKDLNYVYCDLAGLQENRGQIEKLCAVNGSQIVSQSPGNIKAILVVVDLPSLIAARGNSFKETCAILGGMLRRNKRCLDSLYLIITKTPAGAKISVDKIIQRYLVNILEGKDGLQSKKEAGRLTEAECNLAFILQGLIMRPNHILIPDITDNGASKKHIEKLLADNVPLSAGVYNFLECEEVQKEFNEVLIKIAKNYIQLSKTIKDYFPDCINDQKKHAEKLQLEINALTVNIANARLEIKKYNSEAETITKTRALDEIRVKQATEDQQRVERQRNNIKLAHDCPECRQSHEIIKEKINTRLQGITTEINGLKNSLLNKIQELANLKTNIETVNIKIEKNTAQLAETENNLMITNKQIKEFEEKLKLTISTKLLNQPFHHLVYDITRILNMNRQLEIIKFWQLFESDTNVKDLLISFKARKEGLSQDVVGVNGNNPKVNMA